MVDLDWLLILLVVLMTALMALCSTGVLTAPDDPPEPEIEKVVGSV